MNELGNLANATYNLFDLYIWYILAGVLVAAWAYFQLSAAATRRSSSWFLTLFGGLIALGVIWLAFVEAYILSYDFEDPLKLSWFMVPAVLLASQFAICVILVVHRTKQR